MVPWSGRAIPTRVCVGFEIHFAGGYAPSRNEANRKVLASCTQRRASASTRSIAATPNQHTRSDGGVARDLPAPADPLALASRTQQPLKLLHHHADHHCAAAAAVAHQQSCRCLQLTATTTHSFSLATSTSPAATRAIARGRIFFAASSSRACPTNSAAAATAAATAAAAAAAAGSHRSLWVIEAAAYVHVSFVRWAIHQGGASLGPARLPAAHRLGGWWYPR